MFGTCDKAGCEEKNYDMNSYMYAGQVTARLCTHHTNALAGAILATAEYAAFDTATLRLKALIQKGDPDAAASAAEEARPLVLAVRDVVLTWLNEPASV